MYWCVCVCVCVCTDVCVLMCGVVCVWCVYWCVCTDVCVCVCVCVFRVCVSSGLQSSDAGAQWCFWDAGHVSGSDGGAASGQTVSPADAADPVQNIRWPIKACTCPRCITAASEPACVSWQKSTVTWCWELRPRRRSASTWAKVIRPDRFSSDPPRSCGTCWRTALDRKWPHSSAAASASRESHASDLTSLLREPPIHGHQTGD